MIDKNGGHSEPLAAHAYSDDWDESIPDTPKAATTKERDGALAKCDEPGEQEVIPFPDYQKPTYFPAITARTSLFSAARISRDEGEDAPSVKVELSGQNGYKLTAWGPRLNMHDKLVWETAVQVAMEQQHGMGSRFAISLRDFARRMGWNGCSGEALQWIWMSLRRLYFIRLEFILPNGTKGGGSMLSTAIEDMDGNFLIRLNPDFCGPIFHNEKQFLIKSKRRSTLTGQLARWLHDYFSTHNGFDAADGSNGAAPAEGAPKKMKVQIKRLRELSGYSSDRKKFMHELREAMAEIVEKAPELVASSEVSRIGRSSDTWVLNVKRGIEKPAYLMPELSRSEKALPPPPSKQPARRGTAAPRRGGVNL